VLQANADNVTLRADGGRSTQTFLLRATYSKKGKGSPYSITERMVPELIPVLGSQPAGGVVI